MDRLTSLQSFLSGSAFTQRAAALGQVEPFTALVFGWDDFPVDKNVNELAVNLIRHMLAVRVISRWAKSIVV